MSILGLLPTDWRLPISILLSTALGSAVGLIVVPAQTLVQQNTPVWFRGRVYAQMGLLLIVATTLPLVYFGHNCRCLGDRDFTWYYGIVTYWRVLLFTQERRICLGKRSWGLKLILNWLPNLKCFVAALPIILVNLQILRFVLSVWVCQGLCQFPMLWPSSGVSNWVWPWAAK